MIKISFGNRKLPKDTLIFNIPARVTCPGRTELCGGACYALKAEKMYMAVLPARQGNFEASRENSFIADMITVIYKSSHKIKRVRVHESGDFYNQRYLGSWFSIAREFPGITFYAYTKSFHLDFKGLPDNFVLIASFDQTTREASRLTYESKKKKYFSNTFTIVDRKAPATKSTCPGDCRTCSRCWMAKGKNILVNLH